MSDELHLKLWCTNYREPCDRNNERLLVAFYEHNMIGHSIFSDNARKCSSCGACRPKNSYSVCGRCKVCVYCDKDCQLKHWKSEHKLCCKPLMNAPPPLKEFLLASKSDGDVASQDPDLDKQYKYIIILPTPGLLNPTDKTRQTKSEWYQTVQGISDDADIIDLDNYLFHDQETESVESKIRTDMRTKLERKYNWLSLTPSIIAGYGPRYDGFTLRALHCDNCQNRPELEVNRTAGSLLMWQGTCRGVVILVNCVEGIK